MFDLMITPRGDIAFRKEDKPNNRLKLSFIPRKGVKLQFGITNSIPFQPKDTSLKISFDINNRINDKEVMGVFGEEQKMQQISYILNTPIQDIKYRPNVGTKLELSKHKNIHDKHVIKEVEGYILEAIQDILYDPKVIVEPRVENMGRYTQTLEIYIYEKDQLFYNTVMR